MSKIYTRNCEITNDIALPEGMSRIAMGVEYRGDCFHGFQSQASGVSTVQQGLEQVLSNICDEPISLVCAGRTDRGVHATNQVIHFDTLARRPERAWLRGANTQLPSGVSIHWAQTVSPEFHARFSAHSRTYRYLIHNHPTPSSLMEGLVTWDRRRLDVDLMQAASSLLLGEHDFSAFRGADCQAKNPIRRIDHITVSRWENFIITEITATAFLYHMVRNIMGVLLAVGSGEKVVSWVTEVLASRDRCRAHVTAPAAGLYLVNVAYAPSFVLPQVSKGPYLLSGFDNV